MSFNFHKTTLNNNFYKTICISYLLVKFSILFFQCMIFLMLFFLCLNKYKNIFDLIEIPNLITVITNKNNRLSVNLIYLVV